jgi:hypothetical protein
MPPSCPRSKRSGRIDSRKVRRFQPRDRSLGERQPEYGAPSVPDLGNLPALGVAIGLAFVCFVLSTVYDDAKRPRKSP